MTATASRFNLGMSSQAYLPDDLEEIPIGSMMIGESGYTVPWAMAVDPNGGLWLHAGYTYDDRPGGKGKTTNMKVTRTEKGYVVDITREGLDYRWKKYELQRGIRWLPIVKLIR